ncbi:unnamed protein product [Protopolystoma xenopodis]|uniref:C2H2-type domain-containing protein n=1 Tax=Protopolystoma xenopodis TaxID=117903 RepID=A0A448WDM3_9PLAT|nr:unnamed protein product [Protopolystoma xenopodis]
MDGGFSCTCGLAYERMPDFLRHYIDCPVAATDLQDPVHESPSQKRIKLESKHQGIVEQTRIPTENGSSHSELLPNEEGGEVFHKYRHPPVSPIIGPTNDKPFGCPKCPKGFKSKSLLEQHMHIHYPPRYKCRWCGNMYRWPPVYYHHKQKCKKRPGFMLDDRNGTSAVVSLRNSPRIGKLCHRRPLSPADVPLNLENGHPKQSDRPVAIEAEPSPLPQTIPSIGSILPTDVLKASDPSVSMPVQGRVTCLCSEVMHDFESYFEHVAKCSKFLELSHMTPAQPSVITSSFQPPPPSLSNVSHTSDTTIPSPPSAFQCYTRMPSPPSAVCLDLSYRKRKRESYIARVKANKFTKGVADQCQMNADGSFRCIECNKDFSSKLSLKQHIDGKHRPEGKYLCSSCGKRYRWGASFYYHKRNCVHSEDLPLTRLPLDQSTQQQQLLEHNALAASS